ncbi:MAG: hypothetical protein EXQ49_08310 [Acidobacteria bacterium]|nr:hypothetical protein [Acidobacteriota bacterium]
MHKILMTGSLVVAAAVVAAQTPVIQNAKVNTQVVTSLTRDVARSPLRPPRRSGWRGRCQ